MLDIAPRCQRGLYPRVSRCTDGASPKGAAQRETHPLRGTRRVCGDGWPMARRARKRGGESEVGTNRSLSTPERAVRATLNAARQRSSSTSSPQSSGMTVLAPQGQVVTGLLPAHVVSASPLRSTGDHDPALVGATWAATLSSCRHTGSPVVPARVRPARCPTLRMAAPGCSRHSRNHPARDRTDTRPRSPGTGPARLIAVRYRQCIAAQSEFHTRACGRPLFRLCSVRITRTAST